MKFELSEGEFRALYDFFIKRAGYISPEFDLLIWKLIRRMNNELDNNRCQEINNDMDK